MKIAVLYPDGEVVYATDPEINEDKRLRVVCPSCFSPLTYIQTIEGLQYFRHPKRTNKEIASSEDQCENRVSLIKPESIKRYNSILEQTTLLQYQRYFELIVSRVHGYDKKEYAELKAISSLPQTIRLFKNLEKLHFKQLNLIESNKLMKTKDEFHKMYPLAFDMDYIINNTLEHVSSESEMPLWGVKSKEEYPKVKNQLKKTASLLIKMLFHPNSEKIRFFLYVLSADFYQYDKSFCTEEEKTNWLNLNLPGPERGIDCNYAFLAILSEYIHKNNNKNIKENDVIKAFKHSAFTLISGLQYVMICPLTYHNSTNWKSTIDSIIQEKEKNQSNKYDKSGFIYIAFDQGKYRRGIDEETKIGKTKDLAERSSDYQTYSPDGFVFEHAWPVINQHDAERYVHRKLGKYKIKKGGGKEWFALSISDARKKVNSLINEYNKENGYLVGSEAKKGF